jgi:hypothetical protein
MRSPPARHANSNGDPVNHRLSAIGYRLSAIGYEKPSAMECEARLRATRTPTVTLLTIRLSAIGYRLSTIGYRPSAIGYEKPSTMQDKARLHGRERTMYSKTIIAHWNVHSNVTVSTAPA